jgi:hypothetical protein
MPPNFDVVIPDTTCFILLDKIGELELLKSVFEKSRQHLLLLWNMVRLYPGGLR